MTDNTLDKEIDIVAYPSKDITELWDVYIDDKFYWVGTKRQVQIIGNKYNANVIFKDNKK